MPKRTDIKSVMVIGSGPIVIGQAAEFDYSGTQACRVLREEGIRVILVNSNPATIMTDPEMADATYIEPISTPILEQIIAKERPDALLPTLGGQTALNAAMAVRVAGDLRHAFAAGILLLHLVDLRSAQADQRQFGAGEHGTEQQENENQKDVQTKRHDSNLKQRHVKTARRNGSGSRLFPENRQKLSTSTLPESSW